MTPKRKPVPDAYLGIDPGISGGIALIKPDLSIILVAMPATPGKLWDWLQYAVADKPWNVHTCIEQVTGYIPSKGPQPGSRMFNFGRNVGNLEMALYGLKLAPRFVVAQTWQRALSISPRGNDRNGRAKETDAQWKRRLKDVAREIYEEQGVASDITNDVADALLIATYCKRLHKGLL